MPHSSSASAPPASTSTATTIPSPGNDSLRFAGVVLAAGICSGLGAAALTWLLHSTEELVYGHGEVHGGIVTQGVDRWRSSGAVLVVACALAIGWWLLRGRARPLAGVAKMVDGRPAPTPETWANAAFQMIGVGAGLPVGREVAPREAAALMAGGLARRARLDAPDARLVVAAAAGAGLGAVYQVPLAGAVYALELMIGEVTARSVVTCLATSTLAVAVSRVVVSPVPQYAAPALDGGNWRLLVVAVLVGCVLGLPGRLFGDLADRVKKDSQRGPRTLLTLPLAGLVTAAVAWYLPLVLGNGRTAAQTAFLGMGATLALATLAGKCLCTFVVLRAGAVGGTLAPAIAAGALAGVVLGHLTLALVPGIGLPLGAFALLGALAVLATSLRAPIASILLIAGVTGQAHDALLPLGLCAVAAWAVGHLRAAVH